jgi:hypothetical protein
MNQECVWVSFRCKRTLYQAYIIMVAELNSAILNRTLDSMGGTPLSLGNELHYKERVIYDFGRFSLTFDRVDLYRLSLEKYISVELNRLFWVDSWKMPKRGIIGFNNALGDFR